MSVVRIARCPEHGLHGERAECFVCGQPVEQVPMVPFGAVSAATAMLAEFHEHPNALGEGTNTQALRRTLHEEEHQELMHELRHDERGEPPYLEQIARECADVLYVTYGTAWAYGIDLDAALAEVHRAAMDKMNAGLRREDGKILKPPGFRPPDMSAAVPTARPDPIDVKPRWKGSAGAEERL
jgi:NTP pyrophosphatase (non-canonical NTP hydrolase)